MKVTVVPLTSFAHDRIDAHEGKPFDCEKSLAEELELAGLVRIKRPPVQGIYPAAAGAATADPAKGRDDGVGPPSSVSPAAPASLTLTSTSSVRGAPRMRRSVGSSGES